MLRYFLTLISTMAFTGAIAIFPKYWGALQDKRLSGPVLSGLLFTALAIWVIFRLLKEDFPLGAAPVKIFKQYVFYGIQFGSLIGFFCLSGWLLSLGTDWLFSRFLSATIVNGLSFLCFSLFAIGVIRLITWMIDRKIF